MFERFRDRLQHAWNAFNGRDHPGSYRYYGPSYSDRIDRTRLTRGNERSIINAIYNRLSLDVAAMEMHHVRIDEQGRFKNIIEDGLENIMSTEANIDQTARAYLQDVVMSMLDEGCVAEVPVDVNINPESTTGFDIQTIRTGKILEWFPRHIRVRLYNDRSGKMEEIVVDKRTTSIIENPFYAVMNERNSTAQRLIRKLNILDVIDERNGSDKLNMIIQLPYMVGTELKRNQVNKRMEDLETQLANSKYGVAYAQATEKVIQLNRPVENNLLAQIEYLTTMLYSQLSITASVLDGTADEKTMLNYYNRTVEPIAAAIADERKRKFLSKTARSRRESVQFFRNPFKLVPALELARIADVFTRNAILSSNDFRAIIGYTPVDDPAANELVNKNLKMKDSISYDGSISGDSGRNTASIEQKEV